MVVRVTTTNKGTIATVTTGTASALLLCTVLASPGQRPTLEINSGLGGQMSMITVNTDELKSAEYIIDTRILNLVKFNQLAKQWKNERGAHATAAAMAALPSYQKIIGMGKDSLPFILSQLKSEGDAPDHWFWALAAITDENPVPPESRGKLSEMAKAWLEWGQKEGHVE
jgi:hypothetical protein